MKDSNTSYMTLARFYDSLMVDIDYEEWCRFITQVIENYGVKYNSVLEMACGTGTMSVNLALRGYDVTAFDISDEMLSYASSKALEKGAKVTFLHQDMRDIKLDRNFGIILCLCDSINYITNEDELLSVFKWVYRHLETDGIFIFDINSSYKLRNIIGSNTFTHDDEDMVYIWDNYLTDEGTAEFYLTFFIREGELYRRFDELHVEKIYETHEIFNMLKESGFQDIYIKDGFTFDDAYDLSERINFFAVKK